jgi:hypothetical protein
VAVVVCAPVTTVCGVFSDWPWGIHCEWIRSRGLLGVVGVYLGIVLVVEPTSVREDKCLVYFGCDR